MIVEMRRGASQEHVDGVVERARSFGFDVQLNLGTEKVVVAVLGSDTGKVHTDVFAVLPGVQSVTRVMKPYKLASREFHPRPSKVNVSGIEIGGQRIVVMAGPCAVESERQLMETAKAVKECGGVILRGGAFKPRTSPFSFQGLGQDALEMQIGRASCRERVFVHV
jgi:3-deoxy-7-phosphoheptulonate synthase